MKSRRLNLTLNSNIAFQKLVEKQKYSLKNWKEIHLTHWLTPDILLSHLVTLSLTLSPKSVTYCWNGPSEKSKIDKSRQNCVNKSYLQSSIFR